MQVNYRRGLDQTRQFVTDISANFISDIKSVRLDSYAYALAAIHAVLFFWHIFIMNEIPLSVLSAFGVDHAAMMMSLDVITSTKGYFNMNEGPHSIYYGWTYFFFAFLALAPFRLVASLMGGDGYLVIFIGLKIVHFIYGLLSSLALYYFARKFFNKFSSFIVALSLMLGSAVTKYQYIFHPETIGVLFFCLSCIYLIDFVRGGKREDMRYYMTLFLLVMTTLAKPTYLLITMPIYAVLLFAQIRTISPSPAAFVQIAKTKDFIFFMAKSAALAVGTLFVVHPFFFIQFKKMLSAQLYNAGAHKESPIALTEWADRYPIWLNNFHMEPLLALSLFLLIAGIVYRMAFFMRQSFEGKAIAFILVVTAANVLFIFASFKLFISSNYFVPILPILLVNSMGVLTYIFRKAFGPFAAKGFIVACAIFVICTASSARSNINVMLDFYNYKEQTSYKAFDYVVSKIPAGALLLHDHLVGVPDDKRIKSYHYWSVPEEMLRTADADYIMFDPEMKFNDMYQPATIVLRERIASGKYARIETIDNIEVWKKI